MEDINDEDEGTKLKKRRRNVNEVPITRLRTMPITRLSGRITLQYEIMGLKMFVESSDFSSLWVDGGRRHTRTYALSGTFITALRIPKQFRLVLTDFI